MANNVLSAEERRLAAPRGSYEANYWLAVSEADEIDRKASGTPHPDLAKLYGHSSSAWECAANLVHQTRLALNPDQRIVVQEFVGNCTRLLVHFERVRLPSEQPEPWALWPRSPGVSFAHKAGLSALGVAIEFSNAVRGWLGFARVSALGGAQIDSMLTDPPDERLTRWHDATLQEIRERLWPQPPQWPAGEILRDRKAFGAKLYDEYLRALAESDTKDDTPKNSPRKPRQLNVEAIDCIRRYKDARKTDPTMPMKNIVAEYVDEKGGSVTGIMRRINGHPDQWKDDIDTT